MRIEWGSLWSTYGESVASGSLLDSLPSLLVILQLKVTNAPSRMNSLFHALIGEDTILIKFTRHPASYSFLPNVIWLFLDQLYKRHMYIS